MIREKDERIKELTDKFLSYTGVTDQKIIVPDSSINHPIQIGKSSNWPKRKRELERMHNLNVASKSADAIYDELTKEDKEDAS